MTLVDLILVLLYLVLVAVGKVGATAASLAVLVAVLILERILLETNALSLLAKRPCVLLVCGALALGRAADAQTTATLPAAASALKPGGVVRTCCRGQHRWGRIPLTSHAHTTLPFL